jgi:hypothetical protein
LTVLVLWVTPDEKTRQPFTSLESSLVLAGPNCCSELRSRFALKIAL